MNEKPTVKLTVDRVGIALVTLSRPECANALNSAMALEIRDIFNNMPADVRLVILTAAGEKAFCAGADLKERFGMDMGAWQIQHNHFRSALQAIMECPVPVIAAVGGAAFGGGLELAMGCDFIYASENATFALPEVTLGIMCGMGGTQHLPRAVGVRRAKELLYTGRAFTANEALYFGLVNKVCTPENLMPEVMDCAKTIIANAPLSVKSVKHTITRSIGLPPIDGMYLESDYYNNLLHTSDRAEGISAFNQKRKAVFTGT